MLRSTKDLEDKVPKMFHLTNLTNRAGAAPPLPVRGMCDRDLGQRLLQSQSV
jgi:hypothetical protein